MTLRHQTAAIKTMLELRQTYRAARADFAASVRTALESGVTEECIADELLRDSVAHGEIEPLLAIVRDVADDERIPAGYWP